MESGYYSLFMKTGKPVFYLLAKQMELDHRENGEVLEVPTSGGSAFVCAKADGKHTRGRSPSTPPL